MEYKSLKDLTKDTEFNFLSEEALKILWLRFSEIQGAISLRMDEACKGRFLVWLKSGNDDDAWS